MHRILLCMAAFAVAMQAQNASLPLESAGIEGTALPKESVLEVAGLRIGAPVDKAAIEAACARLNDSGLFASIGYRYAPGPKRGYALTLTLADQGPLVDAAIDIPGVDEEQAWHWLAARYPPFDHKTPGNDAAQKFISKALEEHLRASLDGQPVVARMEADLVPRPRTVISFQPETLPKIASLAFTGQRAMTSAELAGLIQKVVADGGYTPRGFRQAVELNLRRAYEERGMYRVRFPSITVQKVSSGAVAVTTAVEEGPQFTLGDVQLVGENLPADAMLKAANLAKGGVANWTAIQNGIWEMEKPLKHAGYLEAASRPERILHDERRVLDLKISFARGPLYRFGQLHVEGLPASLEAQARKSWRMQPGDPFDYAYPNEFSQAFFHIVDARQFKKFSPKTQKGEGDHVTDVTLSFEAK